MKRLIIVIFAGYLLLPLAADAATCCYNEGGSIYGSLTIIPAVCSYKSSDSCPTADYAEIDCATKELCKDKLPVCCVFRPAPGSGIKKNLCYEDKNSNYDCTTWQTAGMVLTRQTGPCSDVPDCAGGSASTLSPEQPPEQSEPVEATPVTNPPILPALSINIPTLSMPDFAKIKFDDEYVYVPFIAVYLGAIYKLAVGLAATAAVVYIMIAGVIWIIAAGNPAQIKKAQGMISSAVVGLILTLGIYSLLQIVNPDLIGFSALKIPLIGQQTLKTFDDFNPEIDAAAPAVPMGPSAYDAIFAKYAPCAGVTPEALKAIATAESGLNASKVNPSGYIGLFQTKPENCPPKVAKYCTDTNALKNPDNNTAAGAYMIRNSIATIAKNCPKAKPFDQMVMIYVGHNLGPGALKWITRKSCDIDGMRKAAVDFYVEVKPATAKSYATKYQKKCVDDDQSPRRLAECTGEKKFDYAVSIAQKASPSQVLASGGTCPY